MRCDRQKPPPVPNTAQIVAEAEATWTAHCASIRQLMADGQLTRDEGDTLCSERSKGTWLRQYLFERWGLNW